MKINPFITLYNARMKGNLSPSREQVTETIVDLIKPVNYISYDDKLKIVDRAISDTANSKHLTADRFRYFVCYLISAYTSLECDLKGFDDLSSAKLLDFVLNTFESEYIICNNLMQMCIADKKDGDG